MPSPGIICRPGVEAGHRRVYAFAHAGGSGTAFLAWQDAMPSGVEVRAVQLPGRGMRLAEAPRTCITALVRELAEAIADDACSVPGGFALLGHSLGGLLAYEVAHLLQSRHPTVKRPLRLFVLGGAAPRHRRPRAPIHTYDDARFIEALQHYQGTPPEVLQHPELMELALPALRADFQLVFDYQRPDHGLLDVPISLMGGLADPVASPAEVAAWAEETSAPCSTHWFEGGHFFLQGPQGGEVVTAVAAQMQELACA